MPIAQSRSQPSGPERTGVPRCRGHHKRRRSLRPSTRNTYNYETLAAVNRTAHTPSYQQQQQQQPFSDQPIRPAADMSPMIYTAYGFAIFFLVFWCGKWCIHMLAIAYG